MSLLIPSSSFSTSSTSAVEELQKQWSVTGTVSGGRSGHLQNNNCHQLMLSCLEHVREAGDEDLLLLRSVLEVSSSVLSDSMATPTTTIPSGGPGGRGAQRSTPSSSPFHLGNLAPLHQELLFHCITGCRHVILTRWESFSSAFRDAVRDLFMGLGSMVDAGSGASSLRPIQMAFFTASVAFWKRNWNLSHEGGEDRDRNSPKINTTPTFTSDSERAVLSIIQQHFVGFFFPFQYLPDLFRFLSDFDVMPQQSMNHSPIRIDMQISCMYLSVMVGEFSGQSTAVSYRLPIEFHQKVHCSFEQNHLEDCLKIVMMALSSVVSAVRNRRSGGNNDDHGLLTNVATTVVKAAIDVLSWEFGASAWLHLTSRTTLIRPPPSWAPYIIQPDFLSAIFDFHSIQCQQNVDHSDPVLAHHLRQLILSLSSLSGPIFHEKSQKKAFVQFLWQGAHQLVSIIPTLQLEDDDQSNIAASLVLDTYTLILRLLQNYKLQQIYDLPSFAPSLESICQSGMAIITAIMQHHEEQQGEMGEFDDDWRHDALEIMWEGVILMCRDPWLCDDRSDPEPRFRTRTVMNEILGPLFGQFIQLHCRIEFLRGFHSSQTSQILGDDHADDEEGDDDVNAKFLKLEEDTRAVCCLGRLNTLQSLAIVGEAFQTTAPKLLEAWENNTAAVDHSYSGNAKKTSFLIRCIGLLLTDSGSRIPASIENECEQNDATIEIIAGAVQAVLTLIQAFASKGLSFTLQDRHSSGLLGSFFWFMRQWISTYICNSQRNSSDTKIRSFWAQPEAVNQAVDFCCWLCVHCLGSSTGTLSDSPANLMCILARQNAAIRMSMKMSYWFQNLYLFQAISCAIPTNEAAIAQIRSLGMSPNLFQQFLTLPDGTKSEVLTGTIVALDDPDHETVMLLNDCLHSVSMVESRSSLSTESMLAWLALLHGIVRAIPQIKDPERLVAFLCRYIGPLAEKMHIFAHDLSVCKCMLDLFCDLYDIISDIKLDDSQMTCVVTAATTLLTAYSNHHCRERQIHPPRTNQEADSQDEKAYNDINTALLLLKKILGLRSAKSFEVSFIGLQQLLPLMTEALLQYPQISLNYFSLISALTDKCTDFIPTLPVDLLNIMLQSLERGVAHQDVKIAKMSLGSLERLFKAHLSSGLFAPNLNSQPDLFTAATFAVIQVAFQSEVFERIEEVSGVLLALLALDTAKVFSVMEEVAQRSKHFEQSRFRQKLEPLNRHDLINNVLETGYEGRQSRKEFGAVVKTFSNEVQALLVQQ